MGLAGCVAPTSSSEDVGQSSAAVTATGMNASLSLIGSNSQTLYLEATVANDTANPASNWQVAINLNQSTINQGVSGAELNVIGGVPIFSPNQNSPQLLQPGSSATFTFSVNK